MTDRYPGLRIELTIESFTRLASCAVDLDTEQAARFREFAQGAGGFGMTEWMTACSELLPGATVEQLIERAGEIWIEKWNRATKNQPVVPPPPQEAEYEGLRPTAGKVSCSAKMAAILKKLGPPARLSSTADHREHPEGCS